jgi:hypothetical protein
MDGKTVCGTLGHAQENQPSVHLFSLYECESGIVLTQETVKNKENEITASAAFLHPFLIKGSHGKTGLPKSPGHIPPSIDSYPDT